MITLEKPITQVNCYTQLPEKDKLLKLAKLYANAFAGDPWNEYKVCKNFHNFGWKQRELTICTNCNQSLDLFYPVDKTVAYITDELTKKNSTLFTFEDSDGNVLAAGWGFECDIKELQEKYRTPAMKQKLVETIRTVEKIEKVFYLSEVFVDEAARQRGIAKTITNRLCGTAQSLNLNLVMRTRRDSPMVKIADKIQMTQLIKVGEDTENPDRVLFIKLRAKPSKALSRTFILLTIMSIMVMWVSTLVHKKQ